MKWPAAFVIVTEGVAPELLDRWCDRGLLPHFARLFAHGVRGRFRSEIVPYEPPALLAAFTGRSPGEHGWFSYWTAQEPEYTPRVLTSADLTHPFAWQMVEFRLKRFAVVNIFGTHPPSPLNGWLISYPTQQTLHACHPPELLHTLSRDGISYAHDVSIWFSGNEGRESFVHRVLNADRARAAAALRLAAEGPDAVIVNLTAIDRLSHLYWQELEAESPVSLLDSAIFQAYRLCDSFLGQVLDRRTEETSILAFSEIGFGPLRAYSSINVSLASAGLLEWSGAGGRCGIDWARTVAYEGVQGTHGVNVNLRSRQAHGTVNESDYERVRTDIASAIEAVINPRTGLPLIHRVLRREEVYEGNGVEGAPDLILEPADARYLPLGDTVWAEHVRRSCQSGWHRRDSYWAGIGPTFDGGAPSEARGLDIVPTLAEMLAVPTPPSCRGRSLGAARCATFATA